MYRSLAYPLDAGSTFHGQAHLPALLVSRTAAIMGDLTEESRKTMGMPALLAVHRTTSDQ